MEEFRSIIGDSVVLGAINNREVAGSDFVKAGQSVTLSDRGRKVLLGAYERRMDTLIRHPIFGYTVSYRRTLEVQARLLSRFVQGEISDYTPFCTR
jgi:CRISPR-associated protein Cas1